MVVLLGFVFVDTCNSPSPTFDIIVKTSSNSGNCFRMSPASLSPNPLKERFYLSYLVSLMKLLQI